MDARAEEGKAVLARLHGVSADEGEIEATRAIESIRSLVSHGYQ
jgi:hypothetical protein